MAPRDEDSEGDDFEVDDEGKTSKANAPQAAEDVTQVIQAAKAEDDEYNTSTLNALANQNYYSMAHAIRESVTAQPNLLSGGNLKEYQVCKNITPKKTIQLDTSSYSIRFSISSLQIFHIFCLFRFGFVFILRI